MHARPGSRTAPRARGRTSGRVASPGRGLEGPASIGAGDDAHVPNPKAGLALRVQSHGCPRPVPVSTLCDVDKSLPVVDPAIRPLTHSAALRPGVHGRRLGRVPLRAVRDRRGRARRRARRQAGGAPLAALGELLATEACAPRARRDRRRRLRARPLGPAAGAAAVGARDGADGGPQRRRAARRRAVLFGGVRVSPGDVIADDDGIVIAPREQLEACLARARRDRAHRGGGARGDAGRRA